MIMMMVCGCVCACMCVFVRLGVQRGVGLRRVGRCGGGNKILVSGSVHILPSLYLSIDDEPQSI